MMKNKPTILVVDDDPNYREMCRIKLSRDYDIMTASDGVEAIRCLNERRPAAVLLDMRMPHASGLDVLDYMNLFPETRNVPVILCTAYMIRGNVRKRLDSRENLLEYVDKLDAVDSMLDRSERAVLLGRLHNSTSALIERIRQAEENLRHSADAAEAVLRG